MADDGGIPQIGFSMPSVRISTLLYALASGAVLFCAWRPVSALPQFVLPAQPTTVSKTPHFETHLLPQYVGGMEVHSATIALLPDGDRLAVWYAGSTEAAPDVALYQSRFHGGMWQTPRPIMTAEKAGAAEHRYTRRIGNPSMFRDSAGKLRLFFVSVSFGGWAGSSINQSVSEDDGETWSPPQKVVSSPLFNLSTLVRHPPVPLEDGGFYLPAYHETIRKFPELLQFDRDGKLVRKVRSATQQGSLQPVLVSVGPHEALCYLRDRCYGDGKVLCQHTHDGGRGWTAPAPLNLPNPDAPVAAGRLADGTFVLVYNPTGDSRRKLAIAASRDGKSWKQIMMLEDGAGPLDEFSYPTLLIDGDGIDVTYTFKRETIKHVRFNAAWIKERFHD
jgi:predicted neuraminidase